MFQTSRSWTENRPPMPLAGIKAYSARSGGNQRLQATYRSLFRPEAGPLAKCSYDRCHSQAVYLKLDCFQIHKARGTPTVQELCARIRAAGHIQEQARNLSGPISRIETGSIPLP